MKFSVKNVKYLTAIQKFTSNSENSLNSAHDVRGTLITLVNHLKWIIKGICATRRTARRAVGRGRQLLQGTPLARACPPAADSAVAEEKDRLKSRECRVHQRTNFRVQSRQLRDVEPLGRRWRSGMAGHGCPACSCSRLRAKGVANRATQHFVLVHGGVPRETT
jgi:hypothetical protein